MKRTFAVLLAGVMLIAATTATYAQRGFRARTFILDDGAGHTFTLQAPPGMTGPFNYTFPSVPSGNVTAGFVPQGTSGQTLRWNSTSASWEANSAITNAPVTGFVGFGTSTPKSFVDIAGTPPTPGSSDTTNAGFLIPSLRHHTLVVENLNNNARVNGIAIVLHNPKRTFELADTLTNNKSNYMTFYSGNGDSVNIRGRIEGFCYTDYLWMKAKIDEIYHPEELLNPLNYVSFNLGFDPNFITFDPNFIQFTLPTFPTITGGSFPSLSWDGISGGEFPHLEGGSMGSLTFSNPFPSITSPITNLTNPVSLNTTFINRIADQIRAIPYRNTALEAVGNPVTAAVKFGTSFFAGVIYESGSGDYAEWLERADPTEKIDVAEVVGLKGGKITKTTDGADQLMVTTWKPIVLGNTPPLDRAADYTKVAFMGQVPVKMRTPVRKGDYLIPDGANDGYAQAISPDALTDADLGKVLGTSWEDSPGYGVKLVRIAVGLRPNSIANVLEKHNGDLDQLQAKMMEVDGLRQEFDAMKATTASTRRTARTRITTVSQK